MKILLPLLSILLLTIHNSYARDTDTMLSVATLPEVLKKNAHAVVRYDKTETKIKSPDEVTYSHKYAVTILDEKGRKYAVLLERYNLMVKVEKIKGKLLNAGGKEIEALREKDIRDYSTFGTSFVYHSDSRVKHYDFEHATYPYTVAYEIEETIKTTFFLPDWEPQISSDYAVESAEFTLDYPSDFPVRYKEYLMPESLQKNKSTNEKGHEVINWQVQNLLAHERQPYSRTGNYDRPAVVISPSNFELLKYKGDMQSWKSLGTFFYELNKDRDVLPEDKKAIVHKLTEGEKDIYTRVQKLYTYMQQSTRYVANEYGISGWQTFDAESVAKNGYGDCKGLTNYLKAMLKEAGITAYAALVCAGDDHFQIDEKFPSNIFNHVILCVPQPKDSIWIECTSQQLPAGYLGSFTQGRKVLLITENGGFVCNTPAYGKDKSYIKSNTTLTLDDKSKQQKIRLHNLYSGLMQDDIEQALKTQPEDKIQEMVNAKFSFPSYSVTNYNYKHTGSQMLPAVEEDVEAIVSGIVSSTQKRTFVNIAWMKNPMTEIFQTEPRTLPFVLKESFKVIDSVKIDLPPGTEIEAMPQAANLKYPFAEYRIRFERSGDRVSMIREYEQNEGVYEAADFEKYQQLYRTINAEKDKLSIVLLNKAP